MKPAAHLLVVDDEPDLLTLYELTLRKSGHCVTGASDLAQARALLAGQRFDALITDMRLPDGLGLELVRELAQAGRPSIVVTAYGSADNAVQALKAGAFDYLTKPVAPAQLRAAVASALQAAQPPCSAAPAEPGPPTSSPNPPSQPNPAAVAGEQGAASAAALAQLVGRSPTMCALRERVQRVARSMAPVLVLGESGTGKELVARALHLCSHRSHGPFIAVNCGAIPDALLEAEFFGVRKGAYTGASAHREGYFQAACGGTLFLDEIGDLPLPMQVKLLRAVQERRVRSLGASADEPTDVRLLSATHLDLGRAVHEGRFRQDLYYRLNVIDLHLPALRQRPEDLPELAQALLQRLAERNASPAPALSPAALARLASHPFPGNVRELENLLERALALHPGTTLEAEAIWLAPPAPDPADPAPPSWPAATPDENAPTRAQLQAWLALHRWNQSRAARQLGWTLAKLRYWMQRHGLADAP